MSSKIVYSDKAPEAIGAYSQAVEFGKLVFLSGQIPLEPSTGHVCSENFEEQVHQVFQNCREVCRAAGGNLHQIVKLTIYVTDMQNFHYVNEIMMQYFNPPYPARAVVGVQTLPRNVKIEIEAIMGL